MLAHGRWFSSTPASSTTKTGRHDIAEIFLKVALKHQKSKSNHFCSTSDVRNESTRHLIKELYVTCMLCIFLIYLIKHAGWCYDDLCTQILSKLLSNTVPILKTCALSIRFWKCSPNTLHNTCWNNNSHSFAKFFPSQHPTYKLFVGC